MLSSNFEYAGKWHRKWIPKNQVLILLFKTFTHFVILIDPDSNTSVHEFICSLVKERTKSW